MGISLKRLGRKITDFGSRVYDQANPLDNGLSYKTRQVSAPARSVGQQFSNQSRKVGTGFGLGGVRAGTGIAQGVSGLYDLATPGRGTNRFSKRLDSFAKNVDSTARAEGVMPSYRTGQLGADALSFVAGGALVKGASKVPQVAKALKPVSNVGRPVVKFTDNKLNNLASKGATGRIGANTIRGAIKPSNVATDLAFTAKMTGEDSSKGRDISPGRVASDAALTVGFGVGIPLTGALAKEGARKTAQMTTRTPKGEVKIKKLTSYEGAPDKARVAQYKKDIQAGKDVGRVKAVYDSDGKLGIEDGKHRLQAYKELGFKSVPTEILNQKPKSQLLAPFREEVGGAPADSPIFGGVGKLRKPVKPKNNSKQTTPPQTSPAPKQSPSGSFVKDISNKVASQAEATKNRYKKPTIRQRVGAAINPYNEGSKIDKAYAKSLGVNQRDLTKTESIEALADKSRSSRQGAEMFMKEGNIGKVVQKYAKKEDSEAFNTYSLFKRDLEQLADGRPQLNRGFTPEEMQKFINDYEKVNPDALSDLRALVKDVETVQDLAIKQGLISPEELALARTKKDGSIYEFYTPAVRATPEELQRATVNTNSVGSIARQSILQDLKGSDIPLDPSFDRITDYVNSAYRQMGRNKVAQKYAERVQQGVAPGTFKQTAENEAVRKTIKQNLQDISATIDSLKSSVRKTVLSKSNQKGSVSKTARGARESQMKIIKEVESLLAKAKGDSESVYNDLVERDPRYAQEAEKIKQQIFPNLTKEEAKEQIKYDLVQLDKKYPKPEKIAKKDIPAFAKSLGDTNKKINGLVAKFDESQLKSAEAKKQLASLKQQILDTQDNIKGLYNARSVARADYAELAPDPTTGLQVISGRKNGQTYKIEVPPEMAQFLQGLGEQQKVPVLDAIGALSQPIRAGLTGVLNPPFALINASWNAVMAPVLSPQGLKVLAPKAIAEGFKAINANSDFNKLLYSEGAQRFTGTLQTTARASTADALAAEASKIAKLKYVAKNPKILWRELDVLSGKLENMQRTGVAKAAYDARIRKNGSVDEAIADAVYAANNVLPNFGRQSNLIKQGDKLAMYLGASVAGTRSMLTALKRDPVGVGARLSGIATIMTGATAGSLAYDNGQEFYQDMIDSKKEYILDNNTIIVLPNAKKDPKTGEWSGIIKIPVAPEFRPMNASVWKSIYNVETGQGIPKGQYAQALFDFTTGSARTLTNPVANLAYGTLTNTDPRTGRDIIPSELEREPSKDQVFSSTSGLAKSIGNAIGQSPLKVDYVLRSFGLPGQVAQEGPVAVKNNLTDRFVGAKGKSDTTKFFDELESISNGIKDKRSRSYFEALHRKTDSESLLNSATKASLYLSRPDVFDAEKKLNDFSKRNGKPSNPLYDLTPEQVQKVLTYRSGKIYNSAGQNKTKDGESAFVSLGLDEKWYQDFKDAENDFYSRVASESDNNDEIRTFSGAIKPTPSSELQAKIDYYYTLGKGTGQRSSFLKANPDVLAYWDEQNDFTDKEREALGFNELKEFGSSGSSGSSWGSSGGGSRKLSVGSPYKYAISQKASGTKPTVQAISTVGKKYKIVATSKPKVSIKKAKV